jgi:hypothetical protein
MTLLLDQQGDQIQITEDVVKAAAGNRGNGKEVMTLLLDQQGDQIHITEDVVKAAAGNGRNGKEVMTLLFNRRGDQIQITEDVVKIAAGNELRGYELMAFLHQRYSTLPSLITDSVLFATASCGQKSILQYFARILNIHVSDTWYRMAQFYSAAKSGNTKILKNLLTQGVDPDTKNSTGQTPLWQATDNGHQAIVRILLQTSSVNVDSADSIGQSPIFRAAARGFTGIVQLLLKGRANAQLIDKTGATAYSLAKKNGHFGAMKLLKEAIKH